MDKLLRDEWLERVEGELTFGKMIKWERDLSGLTLRDFEAITDINAALMCKYENSKKEPSARHYDTLLDFLGGEYAERIAAYKERHHRQ